MSFLTVVADCGDLCGECPIWDITKQHLYWTDCTARKFYRYDGSARKHELIKEGLEIYGYALNIPEGFVVTNTSGIWLWDGADDLQLIAAQAGGSKCQMNDCIADPKGRLLAGSCFYDPSKHYALGKLLSVGLDGAVRILDEGFHLANGLGFSMDCKTLYFTDSADRTIFAYDYDLTAGTVSNRRIFARVPSTAGLPDGLTVDAEGFVWSAEWYGQRIVRYDPDGKLERSINTPAKQTSSLTFGGPELTDIFITSAGKSEPMPLMPPGYDPGTGYFGGALYQINLGIQGRPEFRTNIKLNRG